ncbi:MAG: hypothetical protein ACTSPY_13145 [Candidatus Helarchaeota archaeon]
MIKDQIKFIWIVSNDNKILFQRDFIESHNNKELFVNFFSGIMKFIKKVTQDELENIEMKDSLINYQFANDFFVVIGTEKNVNLKKIRNLITTIKNSFQNQYEGLFETNNPDIFKRFNSTLDIILKNK